MAEDDNDPESREAEERRRSFEEGEAWLQRSLKESERDRMLALRRLVSFYRCHDRPERSEAYLDRLLATTADPDQHAWDFLVLGQMMERSDEYGYAMDYYRRGLALGAGSEWTRYFLHNNLGYCLNHFERHAEAEPLCRAAIAIDPEPFNAHKNLGVALEGQGCYAQAIPCYLRAARTSPQDPRALGHLEALIARHPELTVEWPDLPAKVAECRTLAEDAARFERSRARQSGGSGHPGTADSEGDAASVVPLPVGQRADDGE